ncbi:MAG TPA: GAF domain-containing protein, partial [Vicinamibacterales bacterium]|nr:GAF domain-containing protein [Vicinamibacterales bacterium]
LEQQTATGEILKVISMSPTDVRPVFEAIAVSAARLCEADDGTIFRVDGDKLVLVAHEGPIPALPVGPSSPLTPGRPSARAVLEARTVHVVDLQGEVDEYPEGSELARNYDFRTVLCVPLIRAGAAIGVIAIRRTEARPFTERQADLLKTFADQAVIAIENVRLFTELQKSNHELTTALDQQTATSEILAVISRSQTNVQPVFDTILSSALRLMGAQAGALTRLTGGDSIDLAAFRSSDDGGEAVLRAAFPVTLQGDGAHATAIRKRAPVNIAHAQTDPRVIERGHTIARAVGYQSMVVVPMLHHDVAVGAISATRREPGGFTDDEIALLQTFADQAVIAIENVRLFKELEARNRDLTEALEQQTATSEILRVISASPTDEQPVFEAIVESARRLCEAAFSGVFLVEDGQLVLAAVRGVDEAGVAAMRQAYPRPIARDTTTGRAILDQAMVHIPDSTLDPTYTYPLRETIALRAILTVPFFRDGRPFGGVSVWRPEPGPFTDKQIALLRTFADQALIAIENVRLFKELEEKNRALTAAHAQVTEALEQQTATSEILGVISSSPNDLAPVFEAMLANATRLCEAPTGLLFL